MHPDSMHLHEKGEKVPVGTAAPGPSPPVSAAATSATTA